MRCFDCATEAHLKTEASANCAVCGAGLCAEHAVQGYAEQPVVSGLGNPAVRRLPGRRLFCRSCAPAYLESVPAPFRQAQPSA